MSNLLTKQAPPNPSKRVHVLVTRPHSAGAELCVLLTAHGMQATHLPTIEFKPTQDTAALSTAMQQIGAQNCLIFISPQAVYASIPYIRRAWPELPPTIQLAAITLATFLSCV